MKTKNENSFGIMIILAVIVLAACSSQPEQTAQGKKLKVLAITTIVGDVVANIGGDHIDLSVLLPTGTDPHNFDPTPQDIAKVAEADVIFANGAGLEEFLDPLIESAGAEGKVVHLSEDLAFLSLAGEEHEEEEHEGEEDEHEHTGVDPHTWTDPNNVIVWVHNLERKLNQADPANAAAYQANAQAYETKLVELDAWIRDQVEQISVEDRKLVTDHALFGYYAEEYGFEQVGAIIPAYSTLAEPTAKELADLEDAIRDLDINAIFVGNTVNPALAERVAEDTGTQLVFIYTGSLSEPGGDAGTYLEYMRYNTNAFVNSLAPNP